MVGLCDVWRGRWQIARYLENLCYKYNICPPSLLLQRSARGCWASQGSLGGWVWLWCASLHAPLGSSNCSVAICLKILFLVWFYFPTATGFKGVWTRPTLFPAHDADSEAQHDSGGIAEGLALLSSFLISIKLFKGPIRYQHTVGSGVLQRLLCFRQWLPPQTILGSCCQLWHQGGTGSKVIERWACFPTFLIIRCLICIIMCLKLWYLHTTI